LFFVFVCCFCHLQRYLIDHRIKQSQAQGLSQQCCPSPSSRSQTTGGGLSQEQVARMAMNRERALQLRRRSSALENGEVN
jgi:hypothetical protein